MGNKIQYNKNDIKRLAGNLTPSECNAIIHRFNTLQRNNGYWGQQSPDKQLAKAFVDVCGLHIQTDCPDEELKTFKPPEMKDIVENGKFKEENNQDDEQAVEMARLVLGFKDKMCPFCAVVLSSLNDRSSHVRRYHASRFKQYEEILKIEESEREQF